MWLSRRKDLLGDHRPQPVEWVLLAAIAMFSLFMSSLAIRGLIADLGGLLE